MFDGKYFIVVLNLGVVYVIDFEDWVVLNVFKLYLLK